MAVLSFVVDRVRKLALDDDIRPDIVSAGTDNFATADIVYLTDRIQVLANHAHDNNFREVISALTRVARLAEKTPVSLNVNPQLFENETEKALYAATSELQLVALEANGAEALYQALAALQMPISAYFDATMVNVDNEQIKNNRYAQLNIINQLIAGLGNLEDIVIK